MIGRYTDYPQPYVSPEQRRRDLIRTYEWRIESLKQQLAEAEKHLADLSLAGESEGGNAE